MSFQPNNAFEEQFRQFLAEPGTQDAIRSDQEKEVGLMKKVDEFEKREELQGQREQLAVALQDLDAESQRLIYPILRLKMVQHILFAALKDSRKKGTDFVTSVRQKSLLRMMEKVRDELNNDPDNAMRIEQEWFTTVQSGIEYEAKKKPKKNRQVLPATQMLPIIQSGAQLRINGNHKFKEGKYREALMMYLQGCVGFEMYCATNEQDQQLLDDVHVQVRKNTAGAAIKTRDYTLCIESCNKVLELIPGDTKSLYRRALAQWRLGEVEKASEDLEAILKAKVNDYEAIQEAATAKKAARKLLRQIEESEERAEVVEAKMAKALAITIPKYDLCAPWPMPEPERPMLEELEDIK
ncbi:hypothetical protein AB1Y20_016805 [Prymnesium parvum]|uniref:Peptidylprolyl isomerase n=1 Tax=Prymnesium parvum TaxID=97485 RepID=A0AB34IAT0_PRYPA|mmetsp:Transcript_31549/g.66094  ORF Transcript_31549/g.66094 Transcript_31549/m.66094 type:complete len:353 (-) Transcript_31549:421-1479(-)